MKITTKGDTLEIAQGVEFIERSRTSSPAVRLVAMSEPEVTVCNDGLRQFRWMARVLPFGFQTEFLVSEGNEAYGPELYAIGSEKYQDRFFEKALSFEEEMKMMK